MAENPPSRIVIWKRDEQLEGALLKACEQGNLLMASKVLHTRKVIADLVRDPEGKAVLSVAAQGGHAYIVRVIIAFGGNPNIKDATLSTPLHYAALGKSNQAVHVLLTNGANPRIINSQGLKAADYAEFNSKLWYMLHNAELGMVPAKKPTTSSFLKYKSLQN